MSEPSVWALAYGATLNIVMLLAVYLHHRYEVRQAHRDWRERIAPWVADMEAVEADWEVTWGSFTDRHPR